MNPIRLAALLFFLAGAAQAADPQTEDSVLPPFELTGQSGAVLSSNDLSGHFWVADFIFTRCQGPCPMLTARMLELQRALPPEVRLVSFTVDPEHDTPPVLAEYAGRYRAQAGRWWFLTGEKEKLYGLLRGGFKVGTEASGSDFIHSTMIFLVDPQGRILARYHGDDPEDLKRIVADHRLFSLRHKHPMIARLPALNAALNAAAFFLLIVGFACIRARMTAAHRACMISAFAVSILFLASYLTYHAFAGSKPFTGQGWIRPFYFAVLISHTVLAAVVPVLAILALFRAWKGDFERHRRVARWAYPLWVYVSLTGVLIYAMLYLGFLQAG
jgi:protein SCO1/2/putative membrane protein